MIPLEQAREVVLRGCDPLPAAAVALREAIGLVTAVAVVAAEYVLGMLPRGTHDYSRFIRPSDLDAWARLLPDQLARGLSPQRYGDLSRWLATHLCDGRAAPTGTPTLPRRRRRR